MPVPFSRVKSLTTATVQNVLRDDVPTLSAALAYYTVFSLPPLLVIIVGVAGAIYGPEAVTDLIVGEAASAAGEGVGDEVEAIIANASTLGEGVGGKLVGLVALFLGATGAFGQLQKALNRAWNVEPDGGGIEGVVLKRLLSFGMVLTIAFFLLASLALSAALSAISSAAESAAPGWLAGALGTVLDLGLSLAVITGLFTVLFRVLPDAEIAWRDVWVGALATAVLFTIGKTVLGIYLGNASPGSAFGAAGSLAILLVWIYYSALIVLAGAEFTQAWAQQVGSGIEPDDDAHRADPEAAPEGVPDADRQAGEPAHPLGAPREPAPYRGPATEDPTA